MTNSMATKRISVISISGKMKIPPRKPTAWLGCRHVQVILMSLGFLCCYAIRVSTSIAVEAMTDASKANRDFEEFQWTPWKKKVILSSFFWGYVCTQIPGSVLAQRWGAQRLLSLTLFICGFVTLFIPLAAHYGDWTYVCALRVITGLSQGTVLPTLHTLLSKWVPVEERGRLSTFVYSGGWIGNVMSLLSSGMLSASALGWPSCFYFWGGITLLCGTVYFYIGKESPAEHPNIPHDEKEYIEISLGIAETNEKISTPWIAILTSVPMWALLIAQSVQSWGFWMLLTTIPSYMAKALGFDITQNALKLSLPYLAAWILSFPVSYISDLLIKRNIVTTQASRKICNSIGEWIPAMALIGLGYVNKEQPELAVATLIIAVGSNIAVYCGHNVNHMDLSPNFAGVLMGITNAVATVCSILAPLVGGMVVQDEANILQWRSLFFLSAALYIVGNVIFIMFGTSKIQPWNDPVAKNTVTKKGKNNTMYPVREISIDANVQKSTTDIEKIDIERGF